MKEIDLSNGDQWHHTSFVPGCSHVACMVPLTSSTRQAYISVIIAGAAIAGTVLGENAYL